MATARTRGPTFTKFGPSGKGGTTNRTGLSNRLVARFRPGGPRGGRAAGGG